MEKKICMYSITYEEFPELVTSKQNMQRTVIARKVVYALEGFIC